MGAISTNNAEHYTWGNACDGWHLLAGDDLSVIEERMPPGAAHQMRNDSAAEECFLVVSAPKSHGDRIAME